MRKQRDRLTGETLPRGAYPAMLVQDARQGDGRSIPMTLHRSEWGKDDALAWSRAFTAYLADIIPVGILEEWQSWREWWQTPYILERLAARFGASLVATVVAQTVGTPATSAKEKRARRQMMRAIRRPGGLNPWNDRPEIGRRHFQFPD